MPAPARSAGISDVKHVAAKWCRSELLSTGPTKRRSRGAGANQWVRRELFTCQYAGNAVRWRCSMGVGRRRVLQEAKLQGLHKQVCQPAAIITDDGGYHESMPRRVTSQITYFSAALVCRHYRKPIAASVSFERYVFPLRYTLGGTVFVSLCRITVFWLQSVFSKHDGIRAPGDRAASHGTFLLRHLWDWSLSS